MNPPKVVDIELTPQEVQQDLVKIVESMNKIRFESITSKQISEKQKEEYLHLTYRLASCIEAIAAEEIIDLMQKTIDVMNTQKELLTYDPLQEGYWSRNEKAKEFSQKLEIVLMGLMNEQFQFVEDKHHVLQAIKYLAVRNEEEKDVEEVCNTIRPFQKAIDFKTNSQVGFFEKLTGYFFGENYAVERKDDLTVKIEGIENHVTPVMIEALERGFTTVNHNMFYRNYKPLEQKLKIFVKDTIECEMINWHGRKTGNDSLVSLEIPLRQQVKPTKNINSMEIYEKIIRSEALPEIVDCYPVHNIINLPYGKMTNVFLDSFGIKREQFEISIDQNLKGHCIHSESRINPKQTNCLGIEMAGTEYAKLHTLFLTKEESFIVYVVTPNQPMQYQETASKMILQAKSLTEKAQLLGLQLNAAHVLIKKYVKGTEVDCGEYLHAGGIMK